MSQLNPLIQSEARRDERRSQEYQAQEQYPRREKAKSIFEKILANAKGSFTGQFASRVGETFGAAGASAAPPIVSQMEREQRFQQTPIGQAYQAGQKLAVGAGPIGMAASLTATPITTFLDAAEAVGKIWDEGVLRPLTTASLVTDPTSPLYRGGVARVGEDGTSVERLQPSSPLDAIRMSWERSRSVDLGTAALANPLLYPPVGPAAGIRALIDATQINTYNPWSDESVADAAENPIHYVVAGAINLSPDLFLPPPVRSARIAAQGAAGLRTTVQSAEELAYFRQLWTDHQARKQAVEVSPFEDIVPGAGAPEAGVQPRPTVEPEMVRPVDPYSMLIEDLATERNWGKILTKNPLVANATGVPKTKLAKILAETDDPNLVNEIILASRGDYQAIYNVAAAAPDRVWALGNMNDVVRNAWIEKGFDVSPTGQSLVRLNQVYDSAIARDEYFTQVKDLFMSPDGFVRGGATWMPTKSMTVERIRKTGRGIQYAVKQADYEDAPQWLYKTLDGGAGAPVTTFLQWSSSRQPLGTVSFSGSRPDEWFVELGSQLDSIPIFRGTREVTVGFEPALLGGEPVPIRMPASQYRQQLTQTLVNEADDVGILQAWRNMEDRIIRVMADDTGVDVDSALAFARGGRQTIAEKFGYMAESGGYLWDAEMGRMVMHPVTLSQMLDSFPTLPLNDIYRAMLSEQSLMYRLGSTTQEYTTSAFDAGMKFFRTNVLFKPSYLFKFGALEPLVVTYLAHGTILSDDGFKATMRNVGKNWARRSRRVAYVMGLDTMVKKVVSQDAPKGRKATERYLKTLVTERHLTQRMLDNALMEMDQIRNGTTSRYKAANADPLIREELVEAQLRINAIEDALDGSMPQWRQVVEPASYADVSRKMSEYRAILGDNPEYVASLRDQIDEINRVARARSGDGEIAYTPNENSTLTRLENSLARAEWRPKNMEAFRAQVDRLQQQMDEVAAMGDEFTDPSKRIEELSLALELNEKKIGMAQVRAGEIRRKIESTGFSGYVGSGQGYTTIVVGGEKYQIPSVFSTRQFDFGEALRQEASVALANKLLYDPSYASAKAVARWERTADPVRITPDDPLYWEELSWLANSKWRDDPLVGKVLEGWPRARVAEWLATDEGLKYQKTVGIDYLVKRETYSDPVGPLPKIDPTTGERPVAPKKRPRMLLQSTTELDEIFRLVDQYFPDDALRKRIAREPITPGELQQKLGSNPNLKPIVGDDLIYNPGGKGERALSKINAALDKIWQWIATNPEDRIARWPFFDREFKRQMEIRANIAASQGVRFDPGGKAFKAMRQASTRSALEEIGRVYYNIRRYNSPTYTARFLTMFPGAVVNSFYRYGRFAVKEPERTVQTLVLADRILGEGAIDDEGNPAPLGAASYILIPGTKGKEGDTGLRVPAESLETLAVAVPGLSYVVNMSLAAIVKNKPEVEDMVLRALGPGLFEELFPYGLPRTFSSALFASYQRNFGTGAAALARKAMGLEISDEKFIQTTVQFYSDRVAQWEKEGGDPEDAPSFDDAITSATGYYLQKAFLGWGPPFSVQVRPPGQLWRDAWYDIREQNGGDTATAREIALKQYGDWFRWYTYSSGEYTAYVPSTVEAYTRIWKDYPDLTKRLVSIAGEDLSMVSLLTLGTAGEFSQPVSDFLRDNPLPGDKNSVVSRMTPEKFQNMILVDDGWNLYSTERAKFDAEQARLRTLRDMPDIDKGQKEVYREMISQNDERFASFVEELESGNKPWAVARTNRGRATADRAALFLREMFADPKFMRSTGRTELFSDIRFFLDQRDLALKAISGTRKNEVKKANREKFLEYVTDTFLQENPEFASFFDRYFSSEWVDSRG